MNARRAALQRMGALVLSFGAMHRAWGAAIVGVRVPTPRGWRIE